MIYIYMGYTYIYTGCWPTQCNKPAQSHSSSACVAAFAANPISTNVSTMASG